MSRRSSSNKKLEALLRAQRMNELLKIGGVQSQALLDSAGESRPSDESHVVEILDTERFPRAEGSKPSGAKKARSRPKAAARHKPKPKKKR